MGLDQKISVYNEDCRELFAKMEELRKQNPWDEPESSPLFKEYDALDKKIYDSGDVVWYGRKENHIEAWFQKELGGFENCDEVIFEVDVMRKLVADLEKVIANPDEAPHVIPTQSGFFFGSTEYDEYYYEDIKQEFETFKEALDNWQEGQFFTYWSWW